MNRPPPEATGSSNGVTIGPRRGAVGMLWSGQQATERMLERLDTWQRTRPWASVPVAVVTKYRADQGGRWATLMTHYGFLSLFPSLLVLVTALGAVLSGNPAWQTQILDTAVADVPVLGDQLRANVTSLHASTQATIVGIVLAAYGGGAVLRTAQAAMDVIWAVPAQTMGARLRSQLRVAVVGVMLLAATLVAGVAGGVTTGATSLPGEARALSLGASALLSTAVFLVAFRTLTAARPTWRDVMPGAVVGALCWTGLHAVGGLYISHVVAKASLTYGAFAAVIGLLSWLYLQTRLLLLAAELNAVLSHHLWPRPLCGHAHASAAWPAA